MLVSTEASAYAANLPSTRYRGNSQGQAQFIQRYSPNRKEEKRLGLTKAPAVPLKSRENVGQ